MHRLGVIGLSHRTASLKELERFVIGPELLGERLPALRQACGFSEVALLATCNRVELIFSIDERLPASELIRRVVTYFAPDAGGEMLEQLERPFYAYQGTDAITHLFRVAASLDSMVVGETEILRQMKRAYQLAIDAGTVGTLLHLVFAQAFKAAKRIQTETRLTARPVSMVSLATGLIKEHLASAPAGARVVLVGAGEMTVKTAAYLVSQGTSSLVFVNRTLDRATALAERFGGEAVSLESFLTTPGTAEVIVSATSAPAPLFTVPALAPILAGHSQDRPLLLIDLALPRDFDAAFDARPEVRLHDIEALRVVAAQNQEARAREIERALPLIEHQVRVTRRKLLESRVGPAVTRLQQVTVDATEREVERLLMEELPHLSERDKETLRSWAGQLSRRISQLPVGSLKELAVACECASLSGPHSHPAPANRAFHDALWEAGQEAAS